MRLTMSCPAALFSENLFFSFFSVENQTAFSWLTSQLLDGLVLPQRHSTHTQMNQPKRSHQKGKYENGHLYSRGVCQRGVVAGGRDGTSSPSHLSNI